MNSMTTFCAMEAQPVLHSPWQPTRTKGMHMTLGPQSKRLYSSNADTTHLVGASKKPLTCRAALQVTSKVDLERTRSRKRERRQRTKPLHVCSCSPTPPERSPKSEAEVSEDDTDPFLTLAKDKEEVNRLMALNQETSEEEIYLHLSEGDCNISKCSEEAEHGGVAEDPGGVAEERGAGAEGEEASEPDPPALDVVSFGGGPLRLTDFAELLDEGDESLALEDLVQKVEAKLQAQGHDDNWSIVNTYDDTPKMLEQLFDRVTWYDAVQGTAAVGLAHLLHTDVFGHLHLSAADAATGLLFCAPLILAELALLVPDHVGHVSRKDFASTPVVQEAAYLYQQDLVVNNPAAGVPLTLELAATMLRGLSDNMMLCGVVISALGALLCTELTWTFGLDDNEAVAVGSGLSVLFPTLFSLGTKRQVLLADGRAAPRNLRASLKALEACNGLDILTDEKRWKEQILKNPSDLSACRDVVSRSAASALLYIKGKNLLDVLRVASLGSAFVVTGNFLAPLCGSVAQEWVISVSQRIGQERMVRRGAAIQIVHILKVLFAKDKEQEQDEVDGARSPSTEVGEDGD